MLKLKNKNIKTKLGLFFLGIASSCLTSIPVKAAEKIFLSYSSLILSVRVESLEEFAKTGTINEDLAFYLNLVTPEQRKEFREVLTKKLDVEPILVSRFFNSAMGAEILHRFGKAITIQGGSNGGISMRGAIVQAALDSEGLTLLNVLKKFPTNIQIKGEFVKGAVKEGDKIILATETIVKSMRMWTAEEAKNNPVVNYANLPDIRKDGQYQVKKEVWNLTDEKRNRSLYVDVYIPQGLTKDKISVIVFSHGLASRPEDYSQGLNHAASYGYLVVAPQHPGSDMIYLQEMFEGYHRNIFDHNEFINRPLDISYVIDELERRNSSQFQGKLDLQNVGLGGHSFGGYTALAIAGATLDFEYLQKGCERNYAGLDMALLLQCQALDLPKKSYNFRDERVKAVFAVNPVNRFIFGKQGLNNIKIPILLGSGSYDPATPPALEQIATFIWLTSPDKYWALMEGQAHVNFTKLDGGLQEAIESLNITIPSQSVISNYSNVLSTAFFEVYINQNENYRPYLQSSYAQYLSQDQEFKLNLISGDSSHKVLEAIEKFKKEYGNSENN